MKRKYILPISLLALLSLASCSNQTPDVPNDGDQEDEDKTQIIENTETEPFNDEVIKNNIEKGLDGFRMSGNITQKRYQERDITTDPVSGAYVLKDGATPLETNPYSTDIAYNSKTQNAFYKYSYRTVEGQTMVSEGPYTYFEDENGFAYTENINYKNEVFNDYESSVATTQNGLTFADNGFYNFFTILTEDDFTLDEDFAAYTRYDLNIDKASIIASTLLYSINSGATALPTEAYVRVDNGNFTQLSITLSPIISKDSLTSNTSFITNDVLFTFSNLGEETIEHTLPYLETELSQEISNAFSKIGNNYTVNYTDEYWNLGNSDNTTTKSQNVYFTGNEIYVHDVVEGETSATSANDYYLAPENDSNPALYPYDADGNIHTDGYYLYGEDEDGNQIITDVLYASANCGAYTYNDLLPIITDVSGAFFDEETTTDTAGNENTEIVSKDDHVDSLNDCFFLSKGQFSKELFNNIEYYTVELNNDGSLASISAYYGYATLEGTMRVGILTASFSNVGTTTLPVTIE